MSKSKSARNESGSVPASAAQDILDHAPIGIFTSTPEGGFVSVNPAMADMFGYDTPQDLIDSISNIATQLYVEPRDRDRFKAILEAKGQVLDQELRMKRKDGTLLWVSRSARVLKDHSGCITAYQGFVTDITERKQAQQEVEESRLLLQSVLDTIPARVFWKDLNLCFLGCNRSFANDAGKSSPSELMGKDDYEMGWLDQADLYREDDLAVIESGVPKLFFEEPQTTPDGRTIVLRTSKIPLRDTHGKIVGVLGTYEDITESKLTEAALKKKSEELELYFTSSLDLLCIADVDGRFIRLNPEWEHVLGYSISDLEGHVFLDFVHPEDMESTLAAISKLESQEQILNFVNRYRCKDGDYRWIEWRSKPVGRLIYAAARDITDRILADAEREKLQAQLNQAQKMETVGILAGGVAHDFNNLLHIIRGNVDLLADSVNHDPVSATRLPSIIKSLDRAAQLVQQLLLFSRKAEFKWTRVDVNQEVHDVVRILERTIPRMISLELYLDPALWTISGDPVQIEQILLNLAGNAVDAMPEGGSLVVETSNVHLDEDFVRLHPGSTAGPHVLLSVTDTGCGMDKEVLARVFDPFFTTKEMGKGTGLGLASAYGTVKAHGGYIQGYSEPGKGSTFRVYLPYVEQDEDPALEADPEISLKGGNEVILVVDDEPEIRDLTREALEVLGYTVQTAATGEQALEVYREQGQTIALTLLDLNMPGMGGYKCLQELLRLDPKVKVVIASGYTINGHGKGTLTSGAKGFLGKPFQLRELAAMVRGVLDEKQ